MTTSSLHVSVCFPWSSLCSHPHSHPASPGFSSRPVPFPGLCALAFTLARSFCVSHSGFCSPYSFSFTFPRPPACFTSVITTYSVGTWPSLSPTLHSLVGSLGAHQPSAEPNQQDRRSTMAGHRAAPTGGLFPAASGSRAGLKVEAAEDDPRPSSASVGTCELGVTPRLRTASLCESAKQGGFSERNGLGCGEEVG